MAKVLVVDDDAMLREAYSLVLSSEGFDVAAAEEGEQALQLAQKSDYDVILLDMIMPLMDGLEFTKRFKPKDHPGTKIIIFSNSNASEDAEAAIGLGAYKYVLKSQYTPAQAVDLVKQALGSNKPS